MTCTACGGFTFYGSKGASEKHFVFFVHYIYFTKKGIYSENNSMWTSYRSKKKVLILPGKPHLRRIKLNVKIHEDILDGNDPNVTILCRNDELCSMMSWVGCLLKDSKLFILFAENNQILLKIYVIPNLLTFIYLVAHALLVNNQLNSSSNSTNHCST